MQQELTDAADRHLPPAAIFSLTAEEFFLLHPEAQAGREGVVSFATADWECELLHARSTPNPSLESLR
jgi:hypothetical protein